MSLSEAEAIETELAPPFHGGAPGSVASAARLQLAP